MIAFLFAAGALTLAVLALFAMPLLRPVRWRGIDSAALNARVLRDQMAALQAEHARGALDDEAFARQHQELARRVLDDVGGARVVAGTQRHALSTLGALVLVLPLGAALLYVLLGSPGALAGADAGRVVAGQAASPAGRASPQIQGMVASLASRLAAHPDDPKGWAMLGRSYSVLGRFQDAVSAYGRVGPSLEQHADWLAEYADALAMSAGGSPLGKPEAVARRALRIDPDNLLALMLAGYAASRRGDDADALRLLQHARRETTTGSEDAAFVDNLLQKLRARTDTPAPAASAAPAPAPTASAVHRAADSAVVRVRVDLSPALHAHASGTTLYVIARKPGEHMPVAVLKRTDVHFPLQVSLSDADSMVASNPLSRSGALEIEARLSADGDAMPQRGDDYGTTRVHAHEPVVVVIDRQRP